MCIRDSRMAREARPDAKRKLLRRPVRNAHAAVMHILPGYDAELAGRDGSIRHAADVARLHRTRLVHAGEDGGLRDAHEVFGAVELLLLRRLRMAELQNRPEPHPALAVQLLHLDGEFDGSE
eukprot:3444743-Prymnesium_polylepis.1